MAFRPLPQKELTALQVEWEARLKQAGEGPPEIRSLYQSCENDGMHVVQLASMINDHSRDPVAEMFSESDTVVNTDTFQYWERLADRVRELPIAYPIFARAFLTEYALCGCIKEASARVGISRITAWRYLREFENATERND